MLRQSVKIQQKGKIHDQNRDLEIRSKPTISPNFSVKNNENDELLEAFQIWVAKEI